MALDPDDTDLATDFKRRDYKALEMAGDPAARKQLGEFFVRRFEERFFAPLRAIPPAERQGFTLMAVGCLVVETLQAFREGLGTTKDHSREMFENFFNEDTPLKVFASTSDGLRPNWFYFDIRCGILHEGEARGGWRIWRWGVKLCNLRLRTINAEDFIVELEAQVKEFGDSLSTSDYNWGKFKDKMAQVCQNCEH